MEKNIHFYYRNIILLLLLFFGINSCKKDYIPNEDIEIISEVPPGIVGWYNQRAVNNGIVINGLHNYNPNESIKNEDKKLTLEPEWAKAVSYKKGDSTIAEVPVNGKGRIAFSTSSRDPNSFDFEKSTSFTQFLFIQTPRKIRGVFMTIVAEDSYLKGNLKKLQNNSFRKKEKDFSGFVLYHSIKGIFLNGFRYKNGNVVGKIYAGSAVDVDRTKTSNEITIKTNITVSCSDIPITIYYQQCTDWFNASSGAFLSTTCKYSSGSGILRECVWATAEGGGGGSGGTPPPTTDPGPDDPCSSGDPSISSVYPSVSYSDPTVPCDEEKDCAGVANGTAYMSSCGCIGGTTGIASCQDPCGEKRTVSDQAANSTISAQNALILTNTTAQQKEYGTERNLQGLFSNTYVNTTVRTNGLTNGFTPIFSWNSTTGYTIGASHGHPGGSAPSPADAIWMYNTLNNPELVAAGSTSINYFKDNVSITAVTTSGNYIVTVNDWNALQALSTIYNANPSAFNANFVQIAQNNGFSSEYALLSMFGNAINLYKAPAGSTSFTPIGINSNNTVATKPCP